MRYLKNYIPALNYGAKILPEEIVGAYTLFGDSFYVDGTNGADVAGNGKSPDTAFKTLDYAIGQATANQGDVIFVKEGYTETISAATALLDKAGITIIGMGDGGNMPKITLDTATTATIGVSANDITIEGFKFVADFADIVSFFTLTTAKNFTLDGCKFAQSGANKNALYLVDTDTTTGNADGLTIKNCEWIDVDTACVGAVKVDQDLTGLVVKDNFFKLGVNNNKSVITVANGKSVFDAIITDNYLYRLNTDSATGALWFHTNQTDNSGILARNFAQHADTASELNLTANAGLACFQNFSSGVVGASGYLLPGADS